MIEIPGFDGRYSINEKGEVWSHARRLEVSATKGNHRSMTGGYFISTKPAKNGYPLVQLWKENKCKKLYVHRLLAQIFIPNPENLPQINHKNGIKHDNRLENLEWCTHKQNMRHMFSTGLRKTTYTHGRHIPYTPVKVGNICN